jgi:hypothetical protein
VSSVTQAPSRGWPSPLIAGRHAPDLVVVGREHDEGLGRDVVRRGAEAPAAETRPGPVLHVRAAVGLGQQRERVELGVPALGLAREQDAQGVVEVVRPGGVAAQPQRSGGRTTFGSLRPDSALTSALGRAACTRRAISATRCSGLEATIASMASSRRPARWKSRTHCSALWQTHSRTASQPASSVLSPSPHTVACLWVKNGP